MTTIPHAPASLAGRSAWLDARDLWTTLSIGVIWLAVLVVGVFGPDLVSNGGVTNGGGTTTVPSGVGVAFFAMFATIAVAKYGFGRRSSDR